MYIDIVIPRNNEKSFIAMAEKLGYSDLCLLYDDYDKGIKIVSSLCGMTKIKLFVGLIGGKKSILNVFDCSSKDSGVIRKVFEDKKIDLVFNLELNNKKDHTHFVNSGLDQVLCKLAKKHGKIVCFSFGSLLNVSNFKRSRLLGRIIQNIRFCKKYKVKIAIASFAKNAKEMRYYHDLIALLIVLKAQTSDAKNALKNVYEKIKENKFKKSDKYICEGLTLA